MSMVIMRGFEGGLASLDSCYLFNISSTNKRTGTYSIYATSSSAYFDVAPPSALSEFYAQIAVYLGNDNPYKLLEWRNGTTILGCVYAERIASYQMKLRLYTGDLGSLKVTGTITMTWGAWNVVEVHVKIDDSAGILAMRLNGVADGSDFSGDTKPGSETNITTFRGRGNGLQPTYYDDIIVNDTSGSVNNSWPNMLNVAAALKPTGAGARTELTPSTGNNYQCVDEIPVSATDYVSSNTNAVGDTYAMDNVPGDINNVSAVQVCAYAWKTGSAPIANLKNIVRIGGTDYKGDNKAMSNLLGRLSTIWDVNPATSAQWTPSDVNGLEAGVEMAT